MAHFLIQRPRQPLPPASAPLPVQICHGDEVWVPPAQSSQPRDTAGLKSTGPEPVSRPRPPHGKHLLSPRVLSGRIRLGTALGSASRRPGLPAAQGRASLETCLPTCRTGCRSPACRAPGTQHRAEQGRATQSAQASMGIPACRAVCGSECVGADFLEGETPTGPQRTGPGCEEALTHKDAGTGNPEVCSPSGSRPCLERSGFPPRQGSGGQRAQERLGTAALPLRAKRQWAAPLCVRFRHEHRRTGKHGGKAVCRTGLARRSPDDAQTDREPS